MDERFPIAYATLKRIEDRGRARGVYLWVVERCPICGRQHTHGGGGLDADQALAGLLARVDGPQVEQLSLW